MAELYTVAVTFFSATLLLAGAATGIGCGSEHTGGSTLGAPRRAPQPARQAPAQPMDADPRTHAEVPDEVEAEEPESADNDAADPCDVVFGRRAFRPTSTPESDVLDDGPCDVAVPRQCSHRAGCCNTEGGCCYRGRAGGEPVHVSILCNPEFGYEQPGTIIVGVGERARAECFTVQRRAWNAELRNLDDDRDSELVFSSGMGEEVVGCYDFIGGAYELAPGLCLPMLTAEVDQRRDSVEQCALGCTDPDDEGCASECEARRAFFEALEAVVRDGGCAPRTSPDTEVQTHQHRRRQRQEPEDDHRSSSMP